MEHTLDDNLIASFIDDKLTPLERLVYSDSLNGEEMEEVIEISKDAKSLEGHLQNLEPMRIPECERYVEKIHNHELPSSIDETPKNKLF